MRQAELPAAWGTAAVLLAFFGFAAKGGVVPLHVWLAEAHPVAPSNVSALMSGVMLKTAIYGIVRVVFDLIGNFPWWWGALVLVFGLVSSVMGVLYALMQHDLKRLLAYHSVENIGIILIGIGLAMIFASFNMALLAALALIAGLYHTMNHAMFKGLLFMGAGSVLHATHERNMEEMGGLIKFMPWTAALFLVGCISISALPPFNGFVSEWLTYQAFLLSPALPSPLLNLLIPLGAALLALTSALAAACFVKAFGVTFLGHQRGHRHGLVHEAGWSMRIGMLLAALTCLALGVLPTVMIKWMGPLAEKLVGGAIASSASSLSRTLRRISGFLFSIKEHVRQPPPVTHPAFPERLHYHLRVRDRFWMWLYQPVVDASFWLSRRIGRLQRGRIQVYLIYSFVTILVLLIFSR